MTFTEDEELLSRVDDLVDGNENSTIVFGHDAAMPQFSTLVESRHPDTVFLCVGGEASLNTSGAFPAVMNALGLLDLNMPRSNRIPPEPSTEDVAGIVEQMKADPPDLVVAIGGGSVMDAAKAAYLSWQSGRPCSDFFGSERCAALFPGKDFRRIICIPTTAGTGSEATRYSNIIDGKTNVKRLISDTRILPEYSFVEPAFTIRVPGELTVTTGLDALVHAVESILNWKASIKHPEAEEWGLTAARLIVRALPNAAALPDRPLERQMLSAGATLAGMCINVCPTSLPHMCSFSLYGKVPHGRAVAALLPHFWRWYLAEPEARVRTMLLAGVFGGESPEEVVDNCEKFILSVGASVNPGKIAGVPEDFIKKLASDAALNPMKLESAPRAIKASDCPKVFQEVLGKVWC